MNASKFFLKAANSLVTAVVALFLILAAAYSGYSVTALKTEARPGTERRRRFF